ncbi:LOW QUALITY PROTEIN: hypothetical protein BT93_H2398 [Corymbia citriodora subsp. variegata]|nr:LOW QUALITY PROTEIN: hypothetical protein BT93_H2398 [Corymbia citriodora subsp. variegata]
MLGRSIKMKKGKFHLGSASAFHAAKLPSVTGERSYLASSRNHKSSYSPRTDNSVFLVRHMISLIGVINHVNGLV